jgi:hypothetical protein
MECRMGTASNSNVEILQRVQSKNLRSTVSASWYINNQRCHEGLQMNTVLSEMKSVRQKYQKKLLWGKLCLNIHTYIQFASDISAFYAACHIAPSLYSFLHIYHQVKERNETVTFNKRSILAQIYAPVPLYPLVFITLMFYHNRELKYNLNYYLHSLLYR